MATKKRNRRVQQRRDAAGEAPQSPDDLIAIDNMPATHRMPKELSAAATERKLTIYAPGRGFDAKIGKSRDVPATWEVTLPEGGALGQPGRAAKRMTTAEVSRGIKKAADTDFYRPPWVDYMPHAKIPAMSRPLMRRVDGRPIMPHFGVFGTDDRQVYHPSGYPWTCIGQIFVWSDFSNPNWQWAGAGVLIGGRVVLTAGHMVPWGSRNWAMQFVPAYYDGVSTLGRGVSSWVSDAHGYNIGKVSAWDMAVLRLYTPLGNSYGYFGAKTYSSSWEGGNYWTLAGYPGAVAGGNRPSRQMWFPIVDDDSDGSADELEYYADATPGDSGGPVFGFWSGAPYAVGTHSGGEKTTFLWWTIEDDNAAAGGGALVDLVRWARSNWP